jgi:hypothetical protein
LLCFVTLLLLLLLLLLFIVCDTIVNLFSRIWSIWFPVLLLIFVIIVFLL